MDIRLYNTKDLPYHFVLFYNLPEDRVNAFKQTLQGQEDDNALLTYCYLDSQCGLSYHAVCWATVSEDGNIEYKNKREMTAALIIREGGLECDAAVFDEKDMPSLADFADKIKESYGYLEDRTAVSEDILFDEFRHPAYPNDVIAVFIAPDQKVEKMWVTEQSRSEDGGIIAKLLNEPYNNLMGVHEGDLVKILPYDIGDGKQTPVAVLDWMLE
jgi:hypothetical protein